MQISPINKSNPIGKTNPNFQAELYITKAAKSVMRYGLKTSRWDIAMLERNLTKKLANEAPYSDVFIVDKISKDTERFHSNSPFNYGYETPQLEVRLQDKVTGFFFNTERTISQITEDLYNSYKHVRYLQHYAPKD